MLGYGIGIGPPGLGVLHTSGATASWVLPCPLCRIDRPFANTLMLPTPPYSYRHQCRGTAPVVGVPVNEHSALRGDRGAVHQPFGPDQRQTGSGGTGVPDIA